MKNCAIAERKQYVLYQVYGLVKSVLFFARFSVFSILFSSRFGFINHMHNQKMLLHLHFDLSRRWIYVIGQGGWGMFIASYNLEVYKYTFITTAFPVQFTVHITSPSNYLF